MEAGIKHRNYPVYMLQNCNVNIMSMNDDKQKIRNMETWKTEERTRKTWTRTRGSSLVLIMTYILYKEGTFTSGRERKRVNERERKDAAARMEHVATIATTTARCYTHPTSARAALKANDGNKHRGITSVHSRKADG